MKTGGRKFSVINGGLSRSPGKVKKVILATLPPTFIQLEPVKTFSKIQTDDLSEKLIEVWKYGDDDARTILYGSVARLYDRIMREKKTVKK